MDSALEIPPDGRRRHLVLRLALTAAVLAAVAVPVVVTVASSSGHARRGGTDALRRVLHGLSLDAHAPNFAITYQFTAHGGAGSSATSDCPATTAGGLSASQGAGTFCAVTIEPDVHISGTGVVDTSPFAMSTSSQVSPYGLITTVDNGTDLWEFGGGNYGAGSTGPAPAGNTLAGFAPLVEGTLGPRVGALAMRGLASPTGYLDLDSSALSGAAASGTGTVDGVPVTVDTATLSAAAEAAVPGANPDQQQAIDAANQLLAEDGYDGSTVQVSVDSAGYVLRIDSVARFSDGSTVESDTTYGSFGCAGSVGIPGGPNASAPAPGCVPVDPDEAAAAPSGSP